MGAVVSNLEQPAVSFRELECGRISFVVRSKVDTAGVQSFMLLLSSTKPAARVVAEGTYRILEHGEHTHLDYALDGDLGFEGDDDRELIEQLNIAASGSMIVAVFNPLAKWSREATIRHRGVPDDPSPFREPSLFPDELGSSVKLGLRLADTIAQRIVYHQRLATLTEEQRRIGRLCTAHRIW